MGTLLQTHRRKERAKPLKFWRQASKIHPNFTVFNAETRTEARAGFAYSRGEQDP
jgi:hypothetical protein